VAGLLCVAKFVSWSISLSSGTSGGTLAPLLTIGGGVGNVLGVFFAAVLPAAGVDVRVAALVGMAALFAGASRALLASVVFAFETTHQANGLLPLLVGCSLACFVARMLMQNSIMTEKIARRGLRIPEEYDADVFQRTMVHEIMDKEIKTLSPQMRVCELADRIAAHDPAISSYQAWPLAGPDGLLAGILTRNDLLRALETPRADTATLLEIGNASVVVAYQDESVHEAVARMLSHNIGRLVVVDRENAKKIVGYVSRTNLLATRFRKMQDEEVRERGWLGDLRNGSTGQPPTKSDS
jgi:CBS domain-containing protein